ncbi:MAG: SDR family NAD(P)-dependent oxidoreductase [Clostridiales bacterium]|nr:SDR family NAD(P)-dependent oxidoreductase [Clostridiales bacterium]
MKKVALVTGGTSGIGLATANALNKSGATVYVLSRRPAEIPGLHHIVADVSDEVQVRAAVEAVFEKEGRLDILINNASYGISGAVEFTETADAKRLFEVNLFGVTCACKAAIPLMRAQGGGRIVNISSVAAAAPIPFQTWYSVTKAAVSAYTLALFNEVKQMGVTVCAIMPGDTRTNFVREKIPEANGAYGDRIERSVAKMEKDEKNGMDPDFAGRFVAKIALKKRVKSLYAVGFLYKFLVLLTRILPNRLVGYLLGILYSGE